MTTKRPTTTTTTTTTSITTMREITTTSKISIETDTSTAIPETRHLNIHPRNEKMEKWTTTTTTTMTTTTTSKAITAAMTTRMTSTMTMMMMMTTMIMTMIPGGCDARGVAGKGKSPGRDTCSGTYCCKGKETGENGRKWRLKGRMRERRSKRLNSRSTGSHVIKTGDNQIFA